MKNMRDFSFVSFMTTSAFTQCTEYAGICVLLQQVIRGQVILYGYQVSAFIFVYE